MRDTHFVIFISELTVIQKDAEELAMTPEQARIQNVFRTTATEFMADKVHANVLRRGRDKLIFGSQFVALRVLVRSKCEDFDKGFGWVRIWRLGVLQ